MMKLEFVRKKYIHKNNKKMESNILLAHIDLKANILKIQSSLEEIKLKQPHRTDVIESMQQSERDLIYVLNTMQKMESELQIQHNRIMSLERLNLELKTEIKTIKF